MKIISWFFLSRKCSSVNVFNWVKNWSERCFSKTYFRSFIRNILHIGSMVFSNHGDWKNIMAGFLKRYNSCWITYEILSKIDCIRSECSSLSFCNNMRDDFSGNWKFGFSNLLWWYFFDVGGNLLLFCRKILATLISVSGWFNCCVSWLRSKSYFCSNWFAAWTLLRNCSLKWSFSAWIWELLLQVSDGLCLRSVKFSDWWKFASCCGFFCVFLVG